MMKLEKPQFLAYLKALVEKTENGQWEYVWGYALLIPSKDDDSAVILAYDVKQVGEENDYKNTETI